MLTTSSWTQWLQNLQTRMTRKRSSRSTQRHWQRQIAADCRTESLEERTLLTTPVFAGPAPASAVEGAGTPMVFTISIDAPSIHTTRFLIAVTGTATSPVLATGLAGPGTDYMLTDAAGLPLVPILDVLVPGPGLVPGAVGSYPIKPVINAGDLSATFTLTPLNDSLVEANETVDFTVLNVTFNGGGGPLPMPAVTTGTGTIIDDDTALVSISGTPTVVEGGALTFPVTLSAPSVADTTIKIGRAHV